jgi:hypothetical protein
MVGGRAKGRQLAHEEVLGCETSGQEVMKRDLVIVGIGDLVI